MKVEKKTTIAALTTDGAEISAGDTVIFNSSGKCHVGVFLGFGKKGSLRFSGKIPGTGIAFNVLPKSIDAIYMADVQVDTGFNGMNPPEEREDR